ncbi:MAG TPA: MBL fold metallo-hydrolase [Pyrinomonadaceae bacterium]|nr:MBL fold metallo-hydrolase [Pyrinomonadaceae bacterium]
MANIERRLAGNEPGDFFVDSSCIDCDACRQLAPEVFLDAGDASVVYHQPATLTEVRQALMALVACPTGSIGTLKAQNFRAGIDAFPMPISENVYFCGFTAESSFGAWSYLILRPESEGGNVLVDSPRYAGQLVRKISAMGGVRKLFLSHSDDVADQVRFKEKFDAQRVMHADDGAARLGVEWIVHGDEEIRLDRDLIAIPTPGHTRGHMVLLYKNQYLFTGDHLAWSPERETLTAFRSVCWYSWDEQIRSMEKLLNYKFQWVLPGHGRIHQDSPAEMRKHLERCISWMKARR